jgi:hypothetical protein
VVLLLLVFASIGVEATTVDVGDLAVKQQYNGGGTPWTPVFHRFNGSAYGGPYENFWPDGSTLYFDISMEVKNVCGFTTDFKWVVSINQEDTDNYDIYIESDAKVHNQDATHWVNGVANNGDVTINGHIEIVPQFYWDNIDITAKCTPYRNSVPIGPVQSAQWSWYGPF